MPRHTAAVAAAPDVVYDLIANPQLRARWLPELEARGAPDRALRAGDRFDGEASMLLHRFVGASEVVEATAGQTIEERIVIGARMRTRWTVERTADGCEVTHELDVDFPGGPLGRLERWVLERRLSRMQRAGLARLQTEATR